MSTIDADGVEFEEFGQILMSDEGIEGVPTRRLVAVQTAYESFLSRREDRDRFPDVPIVRVMTAWYVAVPKDPASG